VVPPRGGGAAGGGDGGESRAFNHALADGEPAPEGLAWRRGVPQDAGLFYEYSKPFPAAGVTAVVETSGQSVVTGFDFENVEVRRVFFVPGSYEPAEYAKHDGLMRLGHVGSMAYSETVRALRLALLPGKAD
jgi:hypothetical protein